MRNTTQAGFNTARNYRYTFKSFAAALCIDSYGTVRTLTAYITRSIGIVAVIGITDASSPSNAGEAVILVFFEPGIEREKTGGFPLFLGKLKCECGIEFSR